MYCASAQTRSGSVWQKPLTLSAITQSFIADHTVCVFILFRVSAGFSNLNLRKDPFNIISVGMI